MITADKKTKTFTLTEKMNCFEMLKQMDELSNCDFDNWNIVPLIWGIDLESDKDEGIIFSQSHIEQMRQQII